jgi:hypothetical protein
VKGRFLPADRLELSVRCFSHRRAQPVGIVVHVGNRHALRADKAVREWIGVIAAHRHDAVAFEFERKPATRLAERAAAEDSAPVARHALTFAPLFRARRHQCLDATGITQSP